MLVDDTFFNILKSFEGYASYMYLDSKGIVTIGVGINLKNDSETKYNLGFTNRLTNKLATKDEILKEFNKISGLSWGQGLSYYKSFTTLNANEDKLDQEFFIRMMRAWNDAKHFYPDIEKLPFKAQFALWDMSFNLGYTRLNKYQNLKKALLAGDYKLAAKESYRHGIQKSRNNQIEEWFASCQPIKVDSTGASTTSNIA